MDAEGLEAYLYRHIPISKALGVTVAGIGEEGVRLRAALAPNLNHRSTAFGGSIASLAILSGWSVVRVLLDDVRPVPQIVIQRSSMEYLAPISGDFEAFSGAPDAEQWERFASALERRGKARLELSAEVRSGGQLAGRFQGRYVASRG